jgi:Rad3-related DNA helicase
MGPDAKATLTPGVRRQRDGGFIVFDECDELKDALLGFVEFSLTKRRLRDMKLEPPKKGSHKPTIVKWMTEELVPSLRREAARYARLGDVESQRRARSLKSLVDDALVVANEIPEDNWIRDHSNDFVPFSYKPVQIAPYAGRYLWGHTGKTLLMSATIISPEEMAGTLGLDYEWSVVQVPMRFPVENRQIIVAPVVEMKGGEKVGKESGQWEQMAVSVGKVIERHPGERVLVHTVSYGLAKFLMERVHVSGRKKLTYSNSADREGVLARFRETVGGVLFAPSFERGIDLADDDCRVVVVAKVPFPNLGDPRVSALMHTPGGSESYSVETIRTLVQMTGRGVRHMDDWCVSYILDKQFVTNILKRHERLLPRWWRDALVQNFPVRQLV